MTREEFYDYIYTSAKKQLSDCLKESEIILTKDTLNAGKESMFLALHTCGNGFAPAFDLDGYYDQYMEEDSVDEFLETIVYVSREHAKFMKETNHMSMENYEELKDRIRLRPADGGTRIIRKGREEREPVPRKKYVTEEFPYFQGTFYVDFHNSDGWCIGVPVEEEHLKKWGRTKEDLLAAALKNQLNDKIVLASLEDIIAAEKEDWEEVEDADKEATESTAKAEEAGTEEDTGKAGQEEPRYRNYWTESIAPEEVRSTGLLVLTNNYQNGGAALILNSEILQKLRQILGTNYYILLSSTEEVWILADTKDVDYETVLKSVPGADGSDVPKGILTGELLYYDAETGRIVTAREYKMPKGGEVRQPA